MYSGTVRWATTSVTSVQQVQYSVFAAQLFDSSTAFELHLEDTDMVFNLQERSRDSSVGVATLCGLDGRGLESPCGPRFSAPVQTGPGAQPAVYTIPGHTATGERRYPPTPI